MSNTKETKPGTKDEHEPLIERAAALIKKDALSELARKDPQQRDAELRVNTNGDIEEKLEIATDGTGEHHPKNLDQSLPSSKTEEAYDQKTKTNGKGLTHVDELQANRSQVILPGSSQTRSFEEFRQIKRSVLSKLYSGSESAAKNTNLILVTSARPNEGKTFISTNLAISMASEKDLNVLLVDVDQTNNGISKALGIPKTNRGLNDLINDTSLTLSDVILDTDIEGLSILPAGTYHPLSSELLSSERMNMILEQLAEERYGNIVIFDTPPVLATSEGSILAAKVGQVLFVVQADKTSQTTIKDALEIIGAHENIGFILNKTHVVVGDSQFGSYYSYGYDKPNTV